MTINPDKVNRTTGGYWARVLEQARANEGQVCSIPLCTRMRQTKSISPLCTMHIMRWRVHGSPLGVALRASQYEQLGKRIRIIYESNRQHVGLVVAERKLRHAIADAKDYVYEKAKKVKNPEGRILKRLRDHQVPAVDVLARAAALYCVNRENPGLFEMRRGAIGPLLKFNEDAYYLTQVGRAVDKLMPKERTAGGHDRDPPRRATEGFGRWIHTEFVVFFEQTALAIDRLVEHANREQAEALQPLALPEFKSESWEAILNHLPFPAGAADGRT